MAQNKPSSAPVKVDRSVTSIELITKTSRLLEFDYDVPELVIDNQNILRATPIASNKVLLTALKPGFATITVSDASKNTQTLNILVRGDVRALEMALRQFFPNSNIRATALETGVVLTGTLANANDVEGAVVVAGEYFPKVINNIKLPNSQMIAIEVQVYEVARTKVRELGLDWQLFTSDIDLEVFGANNPTNNLFFSVVGDGTTFNAFLQALERRALARLMDKPVLVTMNGRPAEFLQGGEIPFEINQGLGNVTIQFRPFGTKLDVVPIVQGEGTVRLEVRAEVSEPDASLANNQGVSGFRVRRVNTGVDMKVGHTLALAGDLREEVEAEVRGIPYLMDLPLIGRGFSRVEETRQEVELVILMTPRFVGEVDPSLMPSGGPGRNTVSPSDCELYRDGQLEVPRCGPDCGGLPNQPQDPVPGYYGSYGAPAEIHMAPSVLPVQPESGAVPAEAAVPQANSGFGYPGQSGRPTPRTGSFSLKNLLRR
jgi:pilus assembly protein CpaC